jgi:hypothetical protein
MRALLLASIAFQGGGASVADERWFTEFGEAVLSKADLVLLAKVERALDAPAGTGAALLVPGRVLLGEAPAGKIVVLADRGVFAPSARQDLYLLERWGRGGRWRVRARLSAESSAFEAKLRWIEGQLRAAAKPDPAQRLAETKRFLLGSLREENEWLRREAIAELRRWAEGFPGRFAPGDVETLRGALDVPDAAFHRTLAETLSVLEKGPAPPPAPASRPVSWRSLPPLRDLDHERRNPPLPLLSLGRSGNERSA